MARRALPLLILGGAVAFLLFLPAAGAIPLNDNLASAYVFPSAVHGSRTENITGAGIEAGEPATCHNSNATLWYTWTPPMPGQAVAFSDRVSMSVYQRASSEPLSFSTLSKLNCRQATSTLEGSPYRFNAVVGTEYYFQVGNFGGNPTQQPKNPKITVHLYPPNDEYYSAAVLPSSAAIATTLGHNVGATLADHISGGVGRVLQNRSPCSFTVATVWYEWTPTTSGTAVFDTIGGTDFDTILSAWTGKPGSLNMIACNDGAAPDIVQSRITFPFTAGTNYHIQVAGNGEAQGHFALHQLLLPPNDAFANALALPSAFVAAAAGHTFGAGTEAGEPAPCSMGPRVWYRWTAPGPGTAWVDTLTGTDFDSVLAAYTGSALGALTQVACNDDIFLGNRQSSIGFEVTSGTTYLFQVGTFGNPLYARGNFTLSLRLAPANDDFAQAVALPAAAPSTTMGRNAGASDQFGEPGPCSLAHSAWYTWTPAAPGLATLDTVGGGTDYDTAIAVYTGSAMANLALVGCSDDAGGSHQSELVFPVNAGTTYRIQVGGFPGREGTFALDLQLIAGTPKTTVVVTPVLKGGDGWHARPPLVTIACTAPQGMTCTGTFQRVVPDPNWHPANLGTFPYNVPGTTTVQYYSTASGVDEPVQSTVFKVDTQPPNLYAYQEPEANGDLWNNGPVTIFWVCSDAPFRSGVASAPPPEVVSTQGAGQSRTATCTDVAGNTATATHADLNIDLTPPELVPWVYPLPSEAGWSSGDTTVTWVCTDALAGVADTTGPATFTAEGDGQLAPGHCGDRAYNNADDVAVVRLDKTPPTPAIALDGLAGKNGWWLGDVVATLGCDDALSGVSAGSLGYTLDGAPGADSGPVNITGDARHTLDASCMDLADNVGQVTSPVNIDRVAPHGDVATRPVALGGASVNWAGLDATSGVGPVVVEQRALFGLLGDAYAEACTMHGLGAPEVNGACDPDPATGQYCYRIIVEDVAGNVFTGDATDPEDVVALDPNALARCTIAVAAPGLGAALTPAEPPEVRLAVGLGLPELRRSGA